MATDKTAPAGRRGWFVLYAIIALLLLVSALLAAVPVLVERLVERWLEDNGADLARVEDVDFNPFAGTASVEGADVRIGDRTVLADADIVLDIAWWPLLQRELTIEGATFDGVELEIELLPSGGLRIGSVTLGGGNGDEPSSADAGTGEPWWIRVKELRVTGSGLRLRRGELDLRVAVDEIALENLFTGGMTDAAPFRVAARVDEAPLRITGEISDLSRTIDLHGAVSLDGLALSALAPALSGVLSRLDGSLSVDGTMEFALDGDGAVDTSYQGALQVTGADVALDALEAAGGRLAWRGHAGYRAPAGESASAVALDGRLEGGELEIGAGDPATAVRIGALGLTGETTVDLGDVVEVSHQGELALDDARLSRDAADRPLAARLAAASLQGSTRFTRGADAVDVAHEGTAALRDVRFDGGGAELDLGSLGWDGTTGFGAGGDGVPGLSADGTLTSGALALSRGAGSDAGAAGMRVDQAGAAATGELELALGEAPRIRYAGTLDLGRTGVTIDGQRIVVTQRGASADGDLAVQFGDIPVIDYSGTLGLEPTEASVDGQRIVLAQQGLSADGNLALQFGDTPVIDYSGTLGLEPTEASVDGRRIVVAQQGIRAQGELSVQPREPLRVAWRGELGVEATDATVGDQRIAARGITWSGDIDLSREAGAPLPGVVLDGRLESRPLELSMPVPALELTQQGVLANGRLQLDPAEGPGLDYEGTLEVASTSVQLDQDRYSGDGVNWDGGLTYRHGNGERGPRVRLDGRLAGDGASARLAGAGLSVRQDHAEIDASPLEIAMRAARPAISGSASVLVEGIRVDADSDAGVRAALERFRLRGIAGAGSDVSVEGIEIEGLQATTPGARPVELTLARAGGDSLQVADMRDIRLASLRLDTLAAVDPQAGQSLLGLESLEAGELVLVAGQSAGAGRISIRGADVLAPTAAAGGTPVARLRGADVTAASWHREDGVAVDAIRLDGLGATVHRNADGALNLTGYRADGDGTDGGDVGTADAGAADADAAPASGGNGAQEESAAMPVRIGEISAGGENRITFLDESVSPQVRVELGIERMRVSRIDSSTPGRGGGFSLEGSLQEYSRLAIEGSATPFAASPGLSAELTISEFPMTVIAPYMARGTGYTVRSGDLGLESSLSVEDGILDSSNHIVLRAFEVTPARDELIAQTESELGMPLDKALSLLRDDDNVITLDVPITGPLSEIHIGTGDIINTVMVKAVRASAVTYLTLALQPWGTALLVGKKLAEVATDKGIPLDPVAFEPGSGELGPQQRGYADKLARVLAERPEISVQFCPTLTPADLDALAAAQAEQAREANDGEEAAEETPAASTTQQQQDPPEFEDFREPLIALGLQRAAVLKEYVVTEGGIEPARIIQCAPEYETAEGTVAGVQPLL